MSLVVPIGLRGRPTLVKLRNLTRSGPLTPVAISVLMELPTVKIWTLALLAVFIAPCGAFFHGAASGWGLALRSLASPRGAQQPFYASQLVAARKDGAVVGSWWTGQAQVVAGRWRAESCVTLNMDGRVGVEGGRGSAGRGRGRGGAKHDLTVGRGGSEPTRRSDGRGGYQGRGGGMPAKRGGGPPDADRLTVVIKECSELVELARILRQKSGVMNQVHVGAAWGCLARIGREIGEADPFKVVSSLQAVTRDVLDKMGARAIANILFSMALLHRRGVPADQGLLLAMQRRATAVQEEFIPQSVANVLWALATMGAKADPRLLEAMQRCATAQAGKFKPQNVANLLWALATMGERADRALLEAMQTQATATAWEFIPQAVADVLWAFATMGERADQGLLEALQRQATAKAEEFNPQNVANVLWALATMGVRADRGLMEAMQRQATETAGQFPPGDVAKVLLALATMGERTDLGLLEAMQTRATATAGEFNPQYVANVLWALATMGEKANRGLLGAMQSRAKVSVGEFTPPEVVKLLWALSTFTGKKADQVHKGLLEAMKRRATKTAWDFTPQEITSLMCSLATIGDMANQENQGLFNTMQRQATANAGDFNPQDVANLFWALATMGEKVDRELLGVMQRRATETAGQFIPQDVANVLWALATMGERADRGFIKAMQTRATATAGDFNPQAVANVLWALAAMGEKADRELLEAMQRRATVTIGEFNSQNVANVLWALAVMGGASDGSLALSVDRWAAHILELGDKFSEVQKGQLHQWLLSCELGLTSGTSLPKGIARVKQEIGADCLKAFSRQSMDVCMAHTHIHESRLQREVAAALKSAGLEIQEKFLGDRSGYSIDVLARRPSAAGGKFPEGASLRKILLQRGQDLGEAKPTEDPFDMWAVEVDGRFQFMEDGRTPRGSTLLKRRHLEQLGDRVMSVPFWEWDVLKGGEAKRRYMQDKLGGGRASPAGKLAGDSESR